MNIHSLNKTVTIHNILMEEKLQNYINYRMLMLEEGEANFSEEIAVLVHSLNRLNGLTCTDDQNQ